MRRGNLLDAGAPSGGDLQIYGVNPGGSANFEAVLVGLAEDAWITANFYLTCDSTDQIRPAASSAESEEFLRSASFPLNFANRTGRKL